jgi:hypothetical protein
MGLLERWRSDRPEFVLLTGCVLAVGGNAALAAWAAFGVPAEARGPTLMAATTGAALSALLAASVLRGAVRTAKRFVLLGGVATAVLLLTWPGVLGGGVALVGAVWGTLRTLGGP